MVCAGACIVVCVLYLCVHLSFLLMQALEMSGDHWNYAVVYLGPTSRGLDVGYWHSVCCSSCWSWSLCGLFLLFVVVHVDFSSGFQPRYDVAYFGSIFVVAENKFVQARRSLFLAGGFLPR